MLPRDRLLQCESFLNIAGVSLKDNAQMIPAHAHIIDNLRRDHADASRE
jgi:hypothetical protein